MNIIVRNASGISILLAYDPVMVFSNPISCAIPFLFTDSRESVAVQ